MTHSLCGKVTVCVYVSDCVCDSCHSMLYVAACFSGTHIFMGLTCGVCCFPMHAGGSGPRKARALGGTAAENAREEAAKKATERSAQEDRRYVWNIPCVLGGTPSLSLPQISCLACVAVLVPSCSQLSVRGVTAHCRGLKTGTHSAMRAENEAREAAADRLAASANRNKLRVGCTLLVRGV